MPLACYLRKIPKNSMNTTHNAAMRCGRYLKSVFGIDGFGQSRWIVGCYIDIDYSSYVEEFGEEEFINQCVMYLNLPPERKKFQRTPRIALYGRLELHSYKLKETNGKRFVELELITDEQKNENFWGEGVKLDTGRKNRSSKNRRVS